ncbi:MAG: hypothetical protein KF799_05145 [Bdellovibrionales bacterium]|nr:hypothetical protein [Bdellovibrionales bacterium]
MITIGPFPPALTDRLTGPLKEHGVSFRLMTGEKEVADLQKRNREREPTQYQAHNPHDFMYLELPFEHIMLIRAEVERMGFSLTESDFDPEFEGGDYLCPKCEHHSLQPGLCPKHQLPLLEFSAWVAAQRERGTHVMRNLIWVLALIAAVGASWYYFGPG